MREALRQQPFLRWRLPKKRLLYHYLSMAATNIQLSLKKLWVNVLEMEHARIHICLYNIEDIEIPTYAFSSPSIHRLTAFLD